MISYTLQLSDNAILFLRWIRAGCPKDKHGLWDVIVNSSQWLKTTRKLTELGFIQGNGENRDIPYVMTHKGELALALVLMDLNDAKNAEDLEHGKIGKRSRKDKPRRKRGD